MSETSKYFKVTRKNKSNESSFATERVQKWIDSLSYNSFDLDSSQCSNSFEENEEGDEIDWDDVGSAIGSVKSKRNRPRTPLKTSNIENRLSLNSTNKRKVSEAKNIFLIPVAPTPVKKPKVFKPVVLINNTARSTTSLNQSFDRSASQDLFDDNSCGFSTRTSSQSVSKQHDEDIARCIQNFNSCLQNLSTICPSISGSELVNIETQSEINANDININLPPRCYNETSIDLLLAFNDSETFIKLIHEENLLFESEVNISQFFDSQEFASQEDVTIPVIQNLDFTISNDRPSHVRILQTGLNRILRQENYKTKEKYTRSRLEITSDRVKIFIQKFFKTLNDELELGNKRKIKIKHSKIAWNNCNFESGILVVKSAPETKYSILRSRGNLVLYLMRTVYSLLMLKSKLTQRSIYYQLKSLLPKQKLTQAQVSNGLNLISNILEVPLWELNVLSTSKGLIYGDLTLTIGTTQIKCNAQNGTILPMDLDNLRKVESNAYFVLIVEKDSVFQKLLVDDLPNKMARNFILVTGKGYPDITTRRLLNILWKLLLIPMFIVVDADAYGIDILLTYKFGSMNLCHMNRELALPKLKWFGVLPSEINDHSVKKLPLKQSDVKKLKAMLKRPYFQNGHNPKIRQEIDTLLKNKVMSEIEGLFATNLIFAENYLPTKLCSRSFHS